MTSFRLVYGDFEIAVPLKFSPQIEDQLIACMRLADGQDFELARLGHRIAEALTNSFDGDPIPPTEKQLKYALAICKELGLQLPADCIQIQDSMRAFLSRNAPEYQRRKGHRHVGKS